jgi:hypothetical protein
MRTVPVACTVLHAPQQANNHPEKKMVNYFT